MYAKLEKETHREMELRKKLDKLLQLFIHSICTADPSHSFYSVSMHYSLALKKFKNLSSSSVWIVRTRQYFVERLRRDF